MKHRYRVTFVEATLQRVSRQHMIRIIKYISNQSGRTQIGISSYSIILLHKLNYYFLYNLSENKSIYFNFNKLKINFEKLEHSFHFYDLFA